MSGGSTLCQVLVREEDHTVMFAPTKAQAHAFSGQLLRARKKFVCEPCTDGGWEFTVFERNWPNRWEEGA